MGLTIKRNETARRAVRRLGCKLSRNALDALKNCETLEAVHEVRKSLKQLRALLRLVRSGLGRGHYARITKRLKKAGALLAPVRDASIRVSALALLTDSFEKKHPHRRLTGCRRVLAEDCRKTEQKAPRKLKRSRRLLKRISRDFSTMAASRSGWKVLGPGIRRSYCEGQRAWRKARERGTSDDFHEWRKRSKELLYHARFLGGIWPEQMNALEAELNALDDYLGEAHDLAILAGDGTLKRLADKPVDDLKALKKLALLRQRELHAKALALGTRLFQEKSSSFCERLRLFWRRWRRKPGRIAAL
jgi:CHAD domain-containing protein